MSIGSKTRKLRDKLSRALRKERLDEALKIYAALQDADPIEPRWPHRKGDLLHRVGRTDEAIESYASAVDLYVEQGFVARATAMAKVILGIDPTQTAILARVDPVEARRLHRSTRNTLAEQQEDADDEDHPTEERHRLITDALTLDIDSSAPPDETRFTNVREDEITLEIDISDIEVVQRKKRSSADPDSERPSAEELAQLPSVPLFAEIPQQAFGRLVEESQLVDLGDGQPLIESGAAASALFVLVEGTVEVVYGNDTALTLAEGDVVGESCLLANATHRHEVIARGPVRALKVGKALLDQMVEAHPSVGDVLLEILSRRIISNIVRTSPVFAPFDDRTRGELARAFEVRQARTSTTIFEQGKRPDGLYVPILGDWEAVTADGQSGRLKLGRAMGQHSLLTRGASTVTVRAISGGLVLRMPSERFFEVLDAYPEIRAHLKALADEASSPNVSIVPPEPT